MKAMIRNRVAQAIHIDLTLLINKNPWAEELKISGRGLCHRPTGR
jgi:hypothetical protein